jgi:hypothetical protein
MKVSKICLAALFGCILMASMVFSTPNDDFENEAESEYKKFANKLRGGRLGAAR